jgi:hypothetical protein
VSRKPDIRSPAVPVSQIPFPLVLTDSPEPNMREHILSQKSVCPAKDTITQVMCRKVEVSFVKSYLGLPFVTMNGNSVLVTRSEIDEICE